MRNKFNILSKDVLQIKLTKNQWTLIDAKDFDLVSGISSWFAIGPLKNKFYAAGTKDRKTIYLHRLLLNFPARGIEVDHINGNSLDNRRNNLRLATRMQNCQNARTQNNSGFKGVNPSGKKWMARITIEGKSVYIGTFDDPRLAYYSYCRAAEKYFGEFSNVRCRNSQLLFHRNKPK